MSKTWFYINSSLDQYSGTSSRRAWACSGSFTAPLKLVSETVFGTFENPYVEYYYDRTSSTKNFYGYYNVNNSTVLTGSGSFSTMQGGRLLCSLDGSTPVATSGDHYRYGYAFTYDTYNNTTIRGKYKLKEVLNTPLLSGVSIPIKVTIDGVLCIELVSMLVSSIPDTTYTIKGTKYDGTLSYIDITTSATTSQPVLDFGNEGQDVPTFFKDWIETNADYIYPYNYIVRSYDGNTILGEINNAPPIIKVELYTLDRYKTLTLTGSNNTEYSIMWESDTSEGTTFLGLSTAKNSNRVLIAVNTTVSVTWESDITFYEAYGRYRPPANPFDINLYQNSAEVNRVDKTDYFTGVGTLSGALREECSMLTPSIVYQSENVPTFNYVYIPIFNRYYFVTSLSSVSKNVWRMELNCDVLMTYKEQILLLQGVIGRQENDYNPLLVDTEIPTQNNPIVEVIDIPSDAFNTQTSDSGHNFLITVIGA